MLESSLFFSLFSLSIVFMIFFFTIIVSNGCKLSHHLLHTHSPGDRHTDCSHLLLLQTTLLRTSSDTVPYALTCEFLCVYARGEVCEVKVYIFTHFDKYHLISSRMTPLHTSEECQLKPSSLHPKPHPLPHCYVVFSHQDPAWAWLWRGERAVSCHGLPWDMGPVHLHHYLVHILSALLGTVLSSPTGWGEEGLTTP